MNNIPNSNGRLLDLVFTNCALECSVHHDTLPMTAEDLHHPALSAILQLQSILRNSTPLVTNNNLRYNFRKVNYIKLYGELATVDRSFLEAFQNVNLAVDAFYTRIYDVLDIYVPKFRTSCNRQTSIWFTSDIRKNLKLKYNHFRKWRKTGNNYNRMEFERLRRIVKSESLLAFKSYTLRMESNIKSDPLQFWQFVKSKKSSSRIPGVLHDSSGEYSSPEEIINALAANFSSVYNHI